MRANVAITSPRRLSAVLCALLASACAGHPLSSAPAKENAAMSLSPTMPASPPAPNNCSDGC